MPDFDQIAEWGGGRSLIVNFDGTGRLPHARQVLIVRTATGVRYVTRPVPEAGGQAESDPYRLIIGSVVRDILTKDYHDRVDPFVNVLLEILEVQDSAAASAGRPAAPRRLPARTSVSV